MNPELKQELEKVKSSYDERWKKQTEAWSGFREEVSKLTGIVSKEFSRVLGEIDLSVKTDNVKRNIKINNFEVNYTPQLEKCFDIEINKWGTYINGMSFSDKDGYGYCAYSYLEQVIGFEDRLDPKIKEFKEEFNVRHISYHCNCGSDHA